MESSENCTCPLGAGMSVAAIRVFCLREEVGGLAAGCWDTGASGGHFLASRACQPVHDTRQNTLCNSGPGSGPDAKVQMCLVYLKHWTLNLMPLMVYPKVLFHINFTIKGLRNSTQSLLR